MMIILEVVELGLCNQLFLCLLEWRLHLMNARVWFAKAVIWCIYLFQFRSLLLHTLR